MHRLADGSRISHAPAAGEVSGSATDVYPRTGGGTSRRRPRILHVAAFFDGLSPHGRGNRLCRRGQSFDGSIPVRAPVQCLAEGLSPHGRGNRPAPKGRTVTDGGSIPARAGEPLPGSPGPTAPRGLSPHGRGNRSRARPPDSGVYPRTGGGTSGTGLSPHGRGNPSKRPACPRGRTMAGSIPARAGEPRQRPRAPRLSGHGHPGSIPARAGEPSAIEQAIPGNIPAPGVYPRTGGGTAPLRSSMVSPHGRGNLRGALRRGSIPARAGEPRSCRDLVGRPGLSPHGRGNRPRADGVYPRTGGGTSRQGKVSIEGLSRAAWVAAGLKGLSPHGRGNHSARVRPHGDRGSIPARAGEPGTTAARRRGLSPHQPRRLAPSERVYPRTGGGTGGDDRGSPPQRHPGSIPARAGEPRSGASVNEDGSIPARAGEPHCTAAIRRVYPRTGGGTVR